MIVAVTDTGIITHQDLGNRVSGYNAASGVAEANGGVMTDINGHGTHVAGCAAASGNNSVGVVGMGWNLRVMPVRVSEASTGSASMSVITAGARWAADNGAKTVSASYSGIGSATIETTGEYLHSIDASLLWAANNNAENHAGFDFANVLGGTGDDRVIIAPGYFDLELQVTYVFRQWGRVFVNAYNLLNSGDQDFNPRPPRGIIGGIQLEL